MYIDPTAEQVEGNSGGVAFFWEQHMPASYSLVAKRARKVTSCVSNHIGGCDMFGMFANLASDSIAHMDGDGVLQGMIRVARAIKTDTGVDIVEIVRTGINDAL